MEDLHWSVGLKQGTLYALLVLLWLFAVSMAACCYNYNMCNMCNLKCP